MNYWAQRSSGLWIEGKEVTTTVASEPTTMTYSGIDYMIRLIHEEELIRVVKRIAIIKLFAEKLGWTFNETRDSVIKYTPEWGLERR